MRWSTLLALSCAALCGSSSAFASFTTVNAPIFAEDNRQQILGTLYTGTFAATSPGSLNYTNGSITATRIEDIYQPPTQQLPATAVASNGPINDDQVWQANFHLATAQAVFGDFSQQFGYILGSSGGTYQPLFNASGLDYSVTGSADISSLSGQTLRWARGGESRIFSSRIADNTIDNRDHMITYRIDGLNDGMQTWLLMWEDKFTGEPYADFDFNDLVVKVTAFAATDAVPEPVALAPLAILGVMGLRRRRTAQA